ncbi:heavy metal translocating P-type ATPase [Filimonas effusa]|uniref:Cadmium-translocating P-type ATPase n=1 Tax=Filimonas effusa TaxID=2508721 RepID=A0A4Q1DDX3_9BACT|nr:heavy metal translocating P-type ATPase [Filimonas effusa]RXK86789.1 cadmium-translocating P-type ATPase [Filimonas effusa]
MADSSIVQNTGGYSRNLWQRHGEAIVTGLCLLFIILAWQAGRNNFQTPAVILFALAYITGGYQKAYEGLEALFKAHKLDVDLLMVIAALGAAAIGYWMDGAILIFIFALSGTLEGYTMEKTNKDIKALMQLRPEAAVVLRGDREEVVKIEDLKVGDVILVRPGERIAADGVIIAGSSAVDQASITGESIPVDKQKGEEVYSGTINGQGALEVRVSKLARETMISKIIGLVQEAQHTKPPSQQFVEKFESIYAKGVIGGAMLFLLIPPLLLHWNWQDTVYRAMIFLVVASPCALVASIMPAILSAISNAARNGVLFKGGAHLQNIGDVKAVAFDKTGTLTIGRPRVMDIIPFGDIAEAELLRIAASVETLSEHPIAKAMIQAAKEKGLLLERPVDLQALHGVGVTGVLGGIKYIIGKREVIKDMTLSAEQETVISQLEANGKTVIYVSGNGQLPGILTVQDSIREQAVKVVKELKDMGIKVFMLTGDSKATARAIADQAGIGLVYSELLPAGKVEVVQQIEAKYGKVVMVGDGVNDAPALATASVGVAIGSGGTDVAIETADVILMKDNIEKIPFAIRLSRRTGKVIKQNICFAIAVAVTMIILNFVGGVINLPEGVVGHEGSTVLVVLSGLRLLR